MLAKYILAAFALVFLAAALVKLAAGKRGPQVRTWLLVSGIFALVSAWLFTRP